MRAKTWTVEGKRDPNNTEANIAAFNETGAWNLLNKKENEEKINWKY